MLTYQSHSLNLLLFFLLLEIINIFIFVLIHRHIIPALGLSRGRLILHHNIRPGLDRLLFL